VAAAAREAGKAAAVFLGEPGLAGRYRDLGFNLIASGSAAGLLAGSYAERLAALRA
jgi:2-keto-3-deoxy-L-rhamnonate aldolase RhmA